MVSGRGRGEGVEYGVPCSESEPIAIVFVFLTVEKEGNVGGRVPSRCCCFRSPEGTCLERASRDDAETRGGDRDRGPEAAPVWSAWEVRGWFRRGDRGDDPVVVFLGADRPRPRAFPHDRKRGPATRVHVHLLCVGIARGDRYYE